MANVPRTFENLRDHMIAEQFLQCCLPKLTVFLKERECKSLQELADTTDHYLEAQNLSNLGRVPDDVKEYNKSTSDAQKRQPPRCLLCNRIGHQAQECRRPGKEVTKCNLCGKSGHKSENCWSAKTQKGQSSACVHEATANQCSLPPRDKVVRRQESRRDVTFRKPVFLLDGMPVVEGQVLGRKVRILRDTGSNTAIIRRDLVPDHCLTGALSRVVLTDGSGKEVPEARINTIHHILLENSRHYVWIALFMMLF